MVKIAIIGYGKMGKEIERIAKDRGNTVELIIDLNNGQDLNREKLANVDVAIEFTGPETAYNNILKCLNAETPVVCGSTGWLNKLTEVEKLCKEKNTAFFYASNYSVGANLFFELNKRMAKLMNKFDQYEVSIEETHHIQKLDAPSGTAITLAEGILENMDRKDKWSLSNQRNPEELVINPIRRGFVPGIHTIRYESSVDTISIKHDVKSRAELALGAVLAAEFLKGKKGIFGMKDLFDI